ncbi:MAG TPA: ABC transporter permease [Acidimicrobiales bacterium]|nr:ABC transporter permease [Acidimicrobiales bacterium]
MPGDLKPPSDPVVAALVAVTELRRRLRDRSLLITGLLAPFVLAAIMGIAFRPGAGGALVHIGLVDQAATATGRQIVGAGLESAALPPEIGVVPEPSPAAMEAAIRAGALEGGVIVPASFGRSESVTDLPTARAAANSPLAGPAAEGIAQAIIGRLVVGGLAGAVAHPPPTGVAASPGHARPGPLPPELLAAAAEPPSLAITDEGRGGRQSLLGYFAPSMAIVFLFIGVGAVARSVLAERQTGTIARLGAAPVRAGAVVSGKLGGLLLVALTGILVLWGATSLAFSANWGRAGPVAVMCLVTAVAISGLALLVTSFARDEGQADTATLVIGLVLALLGGNFFPPGSLPTFLADLSLATPNGWALQGFGSLALDGGGWSAVVGPVLALSAFTALCVGVAAPRLRGLLVPR